MNGLADVQREHSKYDEAELSYSQALDIYRRIGDELGQADTLLELGSVQGQRSKHAEAESSYSEALEIYKTIGNDLGRRKALAMLWDAQREQSKRIEAEEAYSQAIAIFASIGDDLGRGDALHGLCDDQGRRREHLSHDAIVWMSPRPRWMASELFERPVDGWGKVTSYKRPRKLLEEHRSASTPAFLVRQTKSCPVFNKKHCPRRTRKNRPGRK